jgi:hypothetical protein
MSERVLQEMRPPNNDNQSTASACWCDAGVLTKLVYLLSELTGQILFSTSTHKYAYVCFSQ